MLPEQQISAYSGSGLRCSLQRISAYFCFLAGALKVILHPYWISGPIYFAWPFPLQSFSSIRHLGEYIHNPCVFGKYTQRSPPSILLSGICLFSSSKSKSRSAFDLDDGCALSVFTSLNLFPAVCHVPCKQKETLSFSPLARLTI